MRARFGDGTLNPLQQFSRAIKQSPEWLFLSGGCSMLKHNKTFQMASENIWDWWNVDFYCHIILDRCLNWNSESLLCEKSSKDFLFMSMGPHLTARSIYMSTFLEISVVIIQTMMNWEAYNCFQNLIGIEQHILYSVLRFRTI